METSGPRPWQIWPLIGLLGFLSLGGFIGGLSFVLDSGGAGLGANVSWLQETPVSDFFLAGLFILGVYGIGSLILMVGLVWRTPAGPPPTEAPSATAMGVDRNDRAGATLVIWIMRVRRTAGTNSVATDPDRGRSADDPVDADAVRSPLLHERRLERHRMR
jgi:hypothetical protein